MIPIGTRVKCLAIDFLEGSETPFNFKGVVTSYSTKYTYVVYIDNKSEYYFREHQLEVLPIYKTEIYKALTEGEYEV